MTCPASGFLSNSVHFPEINKYMKHLSFASLFSKFHKFYLNSGLAFDHGVIHGWTRVGLSSRVNENKRFSKDLRYSP